MAATQAHVVRGVIAHEPPLARVHPEADKWQRFFQSVYRSSFTFRSTFAMMKCAFCVGLDFQFFKAYKALRAARKAVKASSEPYISRKLLTKFLLRQELLPFTHYLPDFQAIKNNSVRGHTRLPANSTVWSLMRLWNRYNKLAFHSFAPRRQWTASQRVACLACFVCALLSPTAGEFSRTFYWTKGLSMPSFCRRTIHTGTTDRPS